MRIFSWVFRTLLFLVALAFALSNTRVTELRFFGFDFVWSAPLVVFLLVFFIAGIVVGLLAVVPALYRQRREIGRLKRDAARASRAAAEPAPSDVASASATAEALTRAGT